MPGGGANLGRWFESAIEQTAVKYRARGIASIHKMPTPYKIIAHDRILRTRSDVDYFGVIKGLAVAFDAKTTRKNSIPTRNVHAHQLRVLELFERCGGIGFLLINLEPHGTWICTPKWWRDTSEMLDRSSIPFQAFYDGHEDPKQECFEVRHGANGVIVDFAPAVDRLRREQAYQAELPLANA